MGLSIVDLSLQTDVNVRVGSSTSILDGAGLCPQCANKGHLSIIKNVRADELSGVGLRWRTFDEHRPIGDPTAPSAFTRPKLPVAGLGESLVDPWGVLGRLARLLSGLNCRTMR